MDTAFLCTVAFCAALTPLFVGLKVDSTLASHLAENFTQINDFGVDDSDLVIGTNGTIFIDKSSELISIFLYTIPTSLCGLLLFLWSITIGVRSFFRIENCAGREAFIPTLAMFGFAVPFIC